MSNEILVKETEQKLIGQLAPVIEGASGGQIKVILNPQEGALFKAQAEAETARRLENSPELQELADAERQLRDEEARQAAEDAAKSAVVDTGSLRDGVEPTPATVEG